MTRACEAAIDLSNMLVRKYRVGVPADARESFALLERCKLLSPEMSARLQKMIGFRHIVIRQYRDLNLAIVNAVIRECLDDMLRFYEVVRGLLSATDWIWLAPRTSGGASP